MSNAVARIAISDNLTQADNAKCAAAQSSQPRSAPNSRLGYDVYQSDVRPADSSKAAQY